MGLSRLKFCGFVAGLLAASVPSPGLSEELPQMGAASPAVITTELEDNDPRKTHAVTPYQTRVSIDFGDQAGGPVRYNTRFPTEATDPNPTSYYHTQAFMGVSGEFSLRRGALQLGVLTRRDLAHPGIKGRIFDDTGETWRVDQFLFHSEAVSVGWVFGEMYYEAPWKTSLAFVMDRASLTTTVSNDATGDTREVQSSLYALSIRARMMFRLLGRSSFDLHFGPEFHAPVYSVASNPASDSPERRLADIAKPEHTGAIGLAAEVGYRF